MKPKTAAKLSAGDNLIFKGYNPVHLKEGFRPLLDPGDLLLFLNLNPDSPDELIVIRVRDKAIDAVFPEEVRRA